MNTSFRHFVRISSLCFSPWLFPAWSQGATPASTRLAATRPAPDRQHQLRGGGDASAGSTPARPGIVLGPNQILTTRVGKAEILLTPGVFLRVGDNSSLRMVSPDLANTKVELQKGRALLDAAEVSKKKMTSRRCRPEPTARAPNFSSPASMSSTPTIPANSRLQVGKAEVDQGGYKTNLGEKHEITLAAGTKLKGRDFEPRQHEDDLYRWAALRSGYLSEASVDAATPLHRGDGPGWYGPEAGTGLGWYWDPYFGAFTFLPGDGIFYGGFGWGFYSPVAAWYSPAHYYRGGPHGFGEFHGPYGHGFAEGAAASTDVPASAVAASLAAVADSVAADDASY